MDTIIPWVILCLVALFVIYRMATSRSRAGRRMLEHMTRQELESLDVEKLKRQGLKQVYYDVLKKKEQQEKEGR